MKPRKVRSRESVKATTAGANKAAVSRKQSDSILKSNPVRIAWVRIVHPQGMSNLFITKQVYADELSRRL